MSAKGQDYFAGLRPRQRPTPRVRLVRNDHVVSLELTFQTDLT